MLTLDCSETTSAIDYSNLNTSIQETFTAIDRFEWQAIDEILQMREQQLYLQVGYKNFEEYCQRELYAWGGYRRINQLLGAKKVIDAVGELGEHIKNERQARPLLRLVKEPEKLKQAVSLALKDNPSPGESDFAAAANIVVPQLPRKKQSIQEPMVPKIQEPVVPQFAKVTVSQQSHPRYGESGTIEADAPNHWQQIVTFVDGERLLINNTDLDAASVPFSRGRNYPPEYTEAIAQIKEQHRHELERLEQELKIGLQTEAKARAEAQVQEQIQSLQQLFKQQKEENIRLQQRLSEMEGLRKLEIENQQLQQRIQELEHAVQQHPVQQWGNTMTQQATKALNKQVKQVLEKTIDLRSLAQEPPKENAQECLRLMGMALKNLASAMNNTQALEAAAIILGSEPTPSAVAYRAEQLEMLPQAVSDVRQVLAKPGCSWQEFWNVAQEYEVIKQDYWAELTSEETDLITALQSVFSQPDTIGIGSIVAHADPYRTLYVERGEVVEELGDEVIVAWDHWKEQSKKTDRYFRDELRFWQPQ
ncbi:ELKS/Rab6-interacting/CAST family protein [Nostoc sp. XA013]|nr:ELKS/Rab6-interacting/CAST family protein [Nostoc sp. XA013]